MKRGIFLDRDGTIIVDKIYLNDPNEIVYLPGVFDALKILRDLGFSFYIATNQSGIARGLVDIQNLYLIHEKIRSEMASHGIDFDGFYYAPYSVESNHFLRKPNPGMLLTAARDHGVELTKSWMIGDRMSDVEAGQAAGTRSILLSEDPQLAFKPAQAKVSNLLAAARFIREND